MKDDAIKSMDAAFPSGHWVLDENNQPQEVGLGTWAQWMETMGAKRVVRQEHIGRYFVSTMFLGLDHRFGPGSPILFETAVFVKDPSGAVEYGADRYMDRYETREQAIQGHEKAVDLAKRDAFKEHA